MASERRKVKYHWSSTSEGCPRKRSCLREPSDVAPSSRPAPTSASRSGGTSSPKRLKVQKEDDVACSPRLPWGSSCRRNTSSSHSSDPGVGGAAAKGCLIRSTRGFLSSGGSPLRPVNPSPEEMASLEEEACSLKVGGCDALESVKLLPRGLSYWGKETKKGHVLQDLWGLPTGLLMQTGETKGLVRWWPIVPWRGNFHTWQHLKTIWKALKCLCLLLISI